MTQLTKEFLAQERRPEETTAQAVERLAKEFVQPKDPSLVASQCVLVRSADVPSNRASRHAWRLDGTKVVVDPTVPAPPHPKQALLDRIQAATSIDELKAVLKDTIRG